MNEASSQPIFHVVHSPFVEGGAVAQGIINLSHSEDLLHLARIITYLGARFTSDLVEARFLSDAEILPWRADQTGAQPLTSFIYDEGRVEEWLRVINNPGCVYLCHTWKASM